MALKINKVLVEKLVVIEQEVNTYVKLGVDKNVDDYINSKEPEEENHSEDFINIDKNTAIELLKLHEMLKSVNNKLQTK